MKRIIFSAACLLALFSFIPAMAVETDIQTAIQAGDLTAVKKIVEKDKTTIKVPNARGRLPLHTACFEGKLDIVKYLLKKGSSVAERDTSYQLTPLHFAAWNGHVDVAKYLLSKKADLNARESDNETPLYYAAALGRLPMIEFLVSRGADVNDTLSRVGNTVVSLAMERRQAEAVKLLISLGASTKLSPKSQYPPNWTLMHTAAWEGGKDLIYLLADHKTPVDQKSIDGRTPLHNACSQGNINGAKALLARGADVNASASNGGEPLSLAVSRGFAELTDILIKSGADVQWVDSSSRRTLLHCAVIKGYGDIAGLLIEKGVVVNAKDRDGKTALDYAAQYGQIACTTLLKTKGAKGNKQAEKEGKIAPISKTLKNGEAVVWYLGHSGWAVRTSGHLMVFDYFKGDRQSDNPGLANGSIAPAELNGLKVIVFASHVHADHYMPAIFDWRKDLNDITYVMGFSPRDREGFVQLAAHESRSIGGAEVTAIESNDSGQGFLVTVDGVTVCHPGDHANRKRDFSEPYKEEIDFMAGLNRPVDVLFTPVTGCNFGDVVAVRMGALYAIEKLRPRAVFPMHAGDGGQAYREFAREARKEGIKVPVNCPDFSGDRFEILPLTATKTAH
ncbi:MAG: ankyrin repeat domain-containing protein [Candidatus Edwardsbacteria bacterium]|nr:ankyrin repeat domain-containing protein [Candidatus Edwardsbacteria bacterium]